MRKHAFILLLLAAATLPARADRREVVRTEAKTFAAAGLARLSLDVPVGEIEVTADDATEARIEIRFLCDGDHRRSCPDIARRAKVDFGRSGNLVDVIVHKFPSWKSAGLNVEAKVIAPKALSVRVDLGVGEVEVRGFEGDVSVDLGVGEVHVEAPETAVHSVSVDTGVGESHLIAAGRHTTSEGLFTREIEWNEGTGRSSVSVDVGVGEAHVRLNGDRTARR